LTFFESTLGQLLDDIAAKYPDHPALIYSDRDLRYTYSEFNQRVTRLAKGLHALGVRRGEHVGIWATNVPDWLVFMFGAARIGAVIVTVNTSYRPLELEYVLRQSDTRLLVTIDGFRDIDYVQTIYKLIPELKNCPKGQLSSSRFPCLKGVAYLGRKEHQGMLKIDELFELGRTVSDDDMEAVQSSLDCHDAVNMQYTSGTTGFPKGVMLTHYNLINNGYAIGERQKFTCLDRLCLPVPLFHCFGITLGVLAAFTHGAAVVPLEQFDPLMVLAVVQKEKCTALHGVPTMFIAELTHPMFNMFDLRSLRTGIMAGSPCPEPIMREVMTRMHCSEITSVYGLTEASPGITQTSTDDRPEVRASTVGRTLPGVEVKIINPDTRAEVPAQTPGELCARGYNLMKGYYKMPAETAQVIDSDGWLHTGDIAILDPDGNYRITGRLKDMIIRGGENIYPKEVEDFLHGMPGIKDVQVVGVPSARYGEEVAAYVQVKNGTRLEASEIQDYCRVRIARYKVPKYIFFVDSFPTTANGKVQKYKLREDAPRRLQPDCTPSVQEGSSRRVAS